MIRMTGFVVQPWYRGAICGFNGVYQDLRPIVNFHNYKKISYY